MSVSRARNKKPGKKDDDKPRDHALRDALPDPKPATEINTLRRRRGRAESS